jgi:Spy/CpxP family protein refolding chaperone
MKSSSQSWPSRPARLFGTALGCALACGVAIAAWASTDRAVPARVGAVAALALPRGLALDRMLDEAQASPTQGAQAHQIFDAADAELKLNRAADRSDRAQMSRLFAQPSLDPSAVEALRERLEARHDAESRRVVQALIDVSQVLNADQRRVIAHQIADGPRPFAGPTHPHPASAANE